MNVTDINYTQLQIDKKRLEVRAAFLKESKNIKNGELSVIANKDLELLFWIYDSVFLNSYIKSNYRGSLKFSLSRRLKSAAGKTMVQKNIATLKPEDVLIEIRMGVDFFFDYNAISGEKQVNGIKTEDALNAFMLVFEHELCHVIEFIVFKSSSCSKPRFKELAGRLFGHSQSYHMLPTQRKIAIEKYGLQPGVRVSFEYNGKQLNGTITAVNKRATVMSPDKKGKYMDTNRNRYTKYLVPLTLLNKL